MKRKVVLVLCLLSLAAVWFLRTAREHSAAPVKASAPRANAVASAVGSIAPVAPQKISSLNFTNPLAFRLTNTALPLRELALKPHAILLQNLMVDTDARMDSAIPAHLKSTGQPGAYLVQARGQLNAAFRRLIASVGASVVSYIPNNAYLVHATAAEAGILSGSPLVQVVLPYEPYYKLQPSLLGLAVTQSPLPPGTALNLGLFASDATAEAQVQKTGATIIGRDRSAFGPVLRVTPPANWTALAQLPGVQAVEPVFRHHLANDLSRVALGVSTDTTNSLNYLGLTGANVLVAVNDSGIDTNHPDFSVVGSLASPGSVPPTRILGFQTADFVDTDGHGTHVAGIIAGNGSKSLTVSNAAQGSILNADFRGKAPAANLFSLYFGNPDYVLQTNAAVIGALISNNSWDNGDAAYDLAASGYDAATRDAIPERPGSQPVLFVFAAGNNGFGNDYGALGTYDSVMSPGTAKNVITVGAIEQLRNITNIVTVVENGVTNTSAYWQLWTDSGSQVAWYSSRGNVGVGTEGTFGRFKPDVVAPGTFVVSTRSTNWNTTAYYGNTNALSETFQFQLVATNALNLYPVAVPPNAVGVNLNVTANQYSPSPFPPMPLYVNLSSTPTTNDFVGTSTFIVPPGTNTITLPNMISAGGFYFAVGNPTNQTVNYNVTVTVYVTNNIGDRMQVLQRMNDSLGGFYRYESGTSMSAAAVSGLLALMQDYFTNKLSLRPSPALLKAMLINGARQVGGNKPATTNQINFDGWGLPNLANSLPVQTNNVSIGTDSQLFFVDQNPTNALATGDAHTYLVTVDTNTLAPQLDLRTTLVWTDPPGDPNAAIKLVNNLDLIVTNLDTGAIYYGNDFSGTTGLSQRWNTNAAPNRDIINNVRQVVLPPLLAGHYSVTVQGRLVNVNSVTAHTNDTVQDFALVVSCTGGLSATNAFTATDGGLSSNPTGSQNITFVTTTNSPLFNQFAGENTPLLGTNNLSIGTNTIWGSSGVVTVGMTNQWHFYVVTNNVTGANYAGFVVFNSATLAIPRMGTLANTTANATRPEADIDMYVSTDPTLTNLNPAVVTSCLAGTVTATANSFGASLGQGGTEFVTFSNSVPGQVYYVGVKSEDRMAAEYAFLPIFSTVPFSALDKDGNQIVNGMLLPVNIPDGGNPNPGLTNVFALAIYPMQIAKVIVTNLDEHENVGDLFGALSLGGVFDILNDHNLSGNTFGTLPLVYDDSRNPIAGSVSSAGPGSLVNFRGKSIPGLFILSEMDDANTATGRVSVLTMKIQPHRDLNGHATIVTVPAGGWFIDYVDVPPGYTNLTFYGTNLPPTAVPPIQMYEKLGNDPTLTDYDQRADLTNGTPPGNKISVGPPLNFGRYFIGLYNPGSVDASVLLSATLGFGSGANTGFSFASAAPAALLDDAVSGSSITVPNTVTQLVASVSVGMVVKSPRISDYTFTLVSPTGQRVLLMENRGGTDTNGAGLVFVYTNVLNSTANGDGRPNTNYLAIPNNFAGITVPITYDFYTVFDEMTVYGTTNPATFYLGSPDFLYDTGFTNNPTGPTTINVTVPPGYTNITIIMNQFGNPYATRGDAWTYTAGAPITNYEYMVFTDDTNLSNVPIKFAQPPFSLSELASNFTLCDFELATNGLYHGPTNIPDALGGWSVPTNLVTVSSVFNLTNQQFMSVTNVTVLTNNQVSVVADPSDSIGDNVATNLLALAYGTITRTIATVPGRIYNVRFWFRGPGINGWWRGEGDATDSSDPEKNANNGTLVGRFNFPAGVVGQSFGFEDSGEQFEFAGTNTYVQIPQSTSLDVGKGGGFTVEGWINPTNLIRPQPLVEWLAKVPVFTNSVDTNFNRVAGPYFNPATGHYYYLLGATNWTISERWATNLGGHLATVNTANEQNWIFDNFAGIGGTNHNLWIGLTNLAQTNFKWVSGQTNSYTNWLSGQPLNNKPTVWNYTFIRGITNSPSGLWVCANTNGFIQNFPLAPTNIVYGVVEVDQIQTNGVQFWVSATNSMPGGTNLLVAGNGGLYANLIDVSNVWHEIYSAPGLLSSNVFSHVALTFDTNSGLAKLFLNGTNIATTNLFFPGGVFTPFVPKTGGDVLLGRDMTPYTNNYFGGRMDEMSIYSRALSDAEIAGIYNVSATATNGLTGKFDPATVPEPGLAEAVVVFGSTSNIIFGVNNQWEVNSYTFTATSNTMPLRITGLQPGILLDDFYVSEAPLANIYYLPEQSLNDVIAGDAASGTWTMQVWDRRVGAYVTNLTQLVSWDLNFILQSNAQVAATLAPQTPTPSTVGPGQTVYYLVNVPAWANWATNVLVSSTLPVNLFFNPTNLPTGANPGDLTMLTSSTGGSGLPTLAVNSPFPLTAANQAGTSYYLGVQNTNATAASVVLKVDFDIMALTNAIPYTSTLTTNDTVRYFSFVVTNTPYEATFQLLQMTNNADLVVRKGVPLPNLTNTDYGSFNAGSADENIYVLTNSTPVPLTAGTWYLGVIRRSAGAVNYTVLAKELANNTPPNIIDLTNATPFNFTAGTGAALTNFFRFGVANNPALTNAHSVRFQLYNLSGNGDLTVQTNALPLAPPFFESSQNVGRNPEMIWVVTNGALTNFPANWYLGVPNHELTNISYTIVATIDTNGYFPAFPGAAGAGGGAMGGGGSAALGWHGTNGTVYHVFNLRDSGVGSLRDAVSSTNRLVVFDVSGTINLTNVLVITNSYLTIAGQTAPGGGITVAGQMTTVQSAHDVIIRDVRFRRGSVDDSLMLTNVNTVIADHISVAWSDTVLSTLNSSNVTVQWSVIADSLYATNNPAPVGSRLRYGGGALSFHHNLYADHYSGSPLLGDNLTLDFVNNVIYNWGIFSGLTAGTNAANPNGATNSLNYVCNYLIAGPDTARFATNYASTNIAFFGGVTNSQFANWIFQTNNFIDSDTNKVLNGGDTKWAMFTNNFTQFGTPFPVLSVPTDEAFLAYEKVLDFAGVNMSQRDAADTNIVTGVRQQTGTLIASSPLSGLVAWWKGEGNTKDSFGSNNGFVTNGAVTYTNGKVGSAFFYNGGGGYVEIPASTNLNVGTGIGFTLEGWIKPSNLVSQLPIFEWQYDGAQPGVHFWTSTTGGAGCLFANIIDTGNSSHSFNSVAGILTTNFQHVALTYDKTTGLARIYRNGLIVASSNLGIFTPKTQTNVLLGARTTTLGATPQFIFSGSLDEMTIYKRSLSSNEIASVYNAGSAGKFATTTVLPYLDSDQDGIPDFWETTFGQSPTNASNNQLSTNAAALGYTTLEEYVNWLAVPHAVAVTNTPVGIDLYQMSGNSGSLAFSVSNAVNGTVYLTNVLNGVTNTGQFSNSIAIFTPSLNYSGYASFDYFVTNTDTLGYFGPVTVSVVVSAVPITFGINTNPPPMFLTNTPPDQTINELVPLTVTNSATDANTNVTLTYSLTTTVDTNAMNLLGWSNAFANVTNTTPVINPTNGVITWTPSEAQGPGVYILTTTVSDNGLPPKTAVNTFRVTVNESNMAPFWLPNVPIQTNYTILATSTLIVTNTAQDLDIPANVLTYTLLSSPVAPNAVISTNGIFTWTPNSAQLGLFTFTTIVTDLNPPAVNATSLSATNVFTVSVHPVIPPFVFSQPAQSVTGASALLPGMVTPNGLPTTAWFEWGTTTNYGSVTPAANVGAGFNVVYTSSAISGLLTNVPYHFRLVAANAAGTNYGFDQILDEANVVVWGANFLGQANYAQLGLSNVTAIAGAYDHNLALKNNGTAVGWGDNTFNQMVVPASLNNNLVAVAGGQSYSLALKNTGAVVAWGANIFPGETNVPAAALNNVVTIASGQYSSTALKNNGTIVAWGASISGLTTVPASLSNSAVAIAGGSFHNLAIRNDGAVVAWGDDSAGQTDVPANLTNVVAISGGSFHSLALKSDGTVVAWGDNSSGQTNVPAALNKVVAIAAGGFHSMALKSDGTVVTWGDGSAGQKDVPTGLTNFVAIAAGNLHSLALTPQSIASLTNIVLSLTNGVAQTNNILPGGITYYRVAVPINADFATNLLLFADARLNVWFTTNTPPTIATSNDSLLFAAATNGISILSTTSAPPKIIPGATYYLGVQNTNSSTVLYGIEVDFHLVLSATNSFSIVYTNIAGTNGFLLTWFAPSNDLFQVQWSPSLPPVWTTFPLPPFVTFNTNFPASAVSAQFNFFDDGSQTGGFGTNRFYRLLLITNAPNIAPVFGSQPTNYFVTPTATLTVTNGATDSDLPAQTLTYALVAGSPAGVTINSTNGVITWTPTLAQAGTTNTIKTIVTDSGAPPLSATNTLNVFVNPLPVLGSVTFGTNGMTLQWSGWTNEQFEVQWTTNLPPSWTLFPGIITSTNGQFKFLDTNAPFLTKFYQLILLP